ncbi:MAG: nucleotidyltransferase domain-containing protein [Methanomassiliicoccales archaeon]|nr:MAG: nucleotidyltransferase domain-containing protein [Methanomassiliicoccales archaeon]
MIELFEKYVDWKILALFLKYPTTEFHVKELARKIDVSPGSVSNAVRYFEPFQILKKEEKGLAHLYRLNEELPLAKHLKLTYTLVRILAHRVVERLLDLDESILSIAIYGSYATGEYDEKSDLDILIITPGDKNALTPLLREVESELGVRVSPQVLKLHEWQRLSRADKVFHDRVVENHILLHGAGLI